MGKFCAAYGCSNSSDKKECRDKGIGFHAFPLNNPETLKIWLIRLKRKDFEPTKHSALCADHFDEKAFEYQNFTGKTQLLKNLIVTNVAVD